MFEQHLSGEALKYYNNTIHLWENEPDFNLNYIQQKFLLKYKIKI